MAADKGRYLRVLSHLPISVLIMTGLVPFAVPAATPAVRPEPLDRLPGSRNDDPFLRLAAAWLLGHPSNTATAYRRDLGSWSQPAHTNGRLTPCGPLGPAKEASTSWTNRNRRGDDRRR